jgi:hypothetical protein
MGKVLIVSPRFPPTNAADVHRVRTSLAHYRAFGWEPTVLAVDTATADCIEDPLLAESLPPDVSVTRVRAWSEAKCRRFGFGQLGYRSLLPLYRAGCALLGRQRYDVIFFSTTVFLSFVLGPLWTRRYGCQIVYDFQDPWYSEQPLYTRTTVPGSWLKYRIDQWLSRRLERFALRKAAHIVSVSAGYVKTLSGRYAWLDADKFTVLPFGAASGDYAFVRDRGLEQTVFRSSGRFAHWVYGGRGGPDMTPVLTVLFSVLAELRRTDPSLGNRLRLHFVGTNYAPTARTYKLVEPLAAAAEIQDLVDETSERLPYFEIISVYEASSALLLIGSIHADYTASKLMTCLLSKKPILALFHRDSLVSTIAAQFPNVFLATFDATPDEAAFRERVRNGVEWLLAPSFDAATIETLAKPWSAEEMTRRQCAIFDRLLGPATANARPAEKAIASAGIGAR